MADGIVLSHRLSEQGVHDWARRAVHPAAAATMRQYVGYEEWVGNGFVRREPARGGMASDQENHRSWFSSPLAG